MSRGGAPISTQAPAPISGLNERRVCRRIKHVISLGIQQLRRPVSARNRVAATDRWLLPWLLVLESLAGNDVTAASAGCPVEGIA